MEELSFLLRVVIEGGGGVRRPLSWPTAEGFAAARAMRLLKDGADGLVTVMKGTGGV